MKAGEIARLLSLQLEGDSEISITGVADLKTANSSELAFTESADVSGSEAGLLIVPDAYSNESSRSIIRSQHPKLMFTHASGLLIPSLAFLPGIHSSAILSSSAQLGTVYVGPHVSIDEESSIADNCQIHSGTRIGRNVQVGAGTVIYPNCVVYDDSVIGQNCVINAGVVIGSPGFGYVKDGEGTYHQFPQLGHVRIGNGVELGANTCIDRGALGDTVIGDGTKIDNQVQVAHNVQIGKNVVIAAQTGISGSTIIEDDCVIGGQVGMGDHAVVRSGAVIGSQAGVLPGKIVREGVWWGTPVQPLSEYKRQNARIKSLDRLAASIKDLKKRVDEIIDAK